MRFQKDDLTLAFIIRAYSDNGITINQTVYSKSVIVGKDNLIENWEVSDVSMLQDGTLRPILALKPELVLLGTGRIHTFLRLEQIAWFKTHHIALEVMSTAAAARTFNALLGEGRNVVAALILSD